MNQNIFLFFNQFATRWPWLDQIMVFMAEELIIVMILVAALPVINNPRWREAALVSIGSAFAARFIVASTIRYFYYNARPYWTLTDYNLLLLREEVSSFPSGHTIFAFALATGVYLYNKKIGLWFYAAAVLVGISRIFVGVHWPSDILAGAVLGILTAYIIFRLVKKTKLFSPQPFE